MGYGMTAQPAWRLEAGLAERVAEAAGPLARGPALVLTDPFWVAQGVAARIADALGGRVHAGPAGEPKLADLHAAIAAARGAAVVVGLGGGSALDLAKTAASLAATDEPPERFLGVVRDFPPGAPVIALPTTAGTGSEFSATNIVALPSGRKSWAWSERTKPALVLMDPELTASLPPALTAWCGMDAFVHAFEAATNRRTHPGAQVPAHAALALVARALPRAVADGGDLAARADMLLASGLAGQAIDACGTAIAHTLSHALAGLAPVHHGLATALAFEVTLPWRVAVGGLDGAAAALGVRAADLPRLAGDLMDACGIDRRLPPAFAGIAPEALIAEIAAPENAPMLAATPGTFDPAPAAHALLAMARGCAA